MLELINTSLPNGLIAGTHGFATVAMTHGISDVMRGRLETLCAYSHRTSAHDATYYTQNPRNWFHVILPQGEHVVGMVSPSEFDYTGRTNRLAKLRVFTNSEMPLIGAAQVLKAEQNWYLEQWEGEPRYLSNQVSVFEKLKSISIPKTNNAPNWEKVFGQEGKTYAQQVAWFLTKNINSEIKPIYFKTSVNKDASGEMLLNLFTELIELVPEQIKQKITFSTYPVSFPNSIVCHLKGIYDKDKVFEAVSQRQVWFDCDLGKIYNHELLPTSNPLTVNEKQVEANTIVSQNYENLTDQKELPIWKTKVDNLEREKEIQSNKINQDTSFKTLIENKKKGPDIFIIVIICIGVFVTLLVAVVFGTLLFKNKQKQIEINNEIETTTNQIVEYTKPIEQEPPKTIEDTNIIQKVQIKQEIKKEKDVAPPQKIEQQEEKQEEVPQQLEHPAFFYAKTVKYWTPDFIKEDENIKLKVFYYDGSKVVETIGGFYTKQHPIRKEELEYELYIGAETKDCDVVKKSPVTIWMYEDTIWYDWEHKETQGSKWFETEDEKNLRLLCFGEDDCVYKKWHENYKDIIFLVTINGEKIFEVTEENFKLEGAVNEFFKGILTPSHTKIENINEKIKNYEQVISKKEKEIKEIDISTLDDKRKKLEELEKQKEKGKNKEEKETLKDQKEALKKDVDDLEKKEKDKKEKEKELENLKKQTENLKEELKKEEAAKQKNHENKYKEIKKYLFSVKIKGIE